MDNIHYLFVRDIIIKHNCNVLGFKSEEDQQHPHQWNARRHTQANSTDLKTQPDWIDSGLFLQTYRQHDKKLTLKKESCRN